MRSKPAKEVLPVTMSEQSLELSRSTIGPLVVMSGYLTKKAHSRNRWLHRWYQLLDNGILQYYLDDRKVKLLGEIDIGRTCYDVRSGAKNSGVTFPRVAPKCCCFYFSVLKRTYYMYAPTAMEAKKWFESIHGASNVLNRRVVAGVKRRKAPEPPGPPRPPSAPLNYRISRTPVDMSMRYQRASSLQDVHRIRVRLDSSDITSPASDELRQLTQASRVFSVPDSLDSIGAMSPFDSGADGWLIDSPPPDPTSFTMPLNKASSPIVAVAGGSFGSSSPSHLDSVVTSHSLTLGSVSPLHSQPLMTRRRAHSLPGGCANVSCLSKKPKHTLPTRPASVATYPKSCFSNEQPQPKPRVRCSAGVRVLPLNNKALKSKLKAKSRSTEALFDGTPQQRSESPPIRRPVPKPRKQKEAMESEVEPLVPNRLSKVTFSEHPSIINITSPSDTDSSDSVSLTTEAVLKADEIEDLPPPRPRKNSGPPRFIPPPPPQEDKDDNPDS